MNHLNNLPTDFSSFRAYFVSEDENGYEKRSLLSPTLTQFILANFLKHQATLGESYSGERFSITEQGIRYCKDGKWNEADEKSRVIGKSLLGQVEEYLHSPSLQKDKKEKFSKLYLSLSQHQTPLEFPNDDLSETLSFTTFLKFWTDQARISSQISNDWEKKLWALNLGKLVREDNGRILHQLEHYRNLENTTSSFKSFIDNCYEMLEIGLGFSRPAPIVIKPTVEQNPLDDLPTPKFNNTQNSGVTIFPSEIQASIEVEKKDLNLAIEQYLTLMDDEKNHIKKLLGLIHTEEVNKNYIFSKCKEVLRERNVELEKISVELRNGELQIALNHYAELAKDLESIASYMENASSWGQIMNNRMSSFLPNELKNANGFFGFFQSQALELFAVPRPASINGNNINVECLQNMYSLESLSDLGSTYKCFEESLQGLYKFRNLVGVISTFMTDPLAKERFIQNLQDAKLEAPEVSYFFDVFVPLYQEVEDQILHMTEARNEWAQQQKEYEVIKKELKAIEVGIQQGYLFAPVFKGGLHERMTQMILFLESENPSDYIDVETLKLEIQRLLEKYEVTYRKTNLLQCNITKYFNSEVYKRYLNIFVDLKKIIDTCQVFIDSENLELPALNQGIIKTYDELSKNPKHPILDFTKSSFLNSTSSFFMETFQHLMFVQNNLLNKELLATFLASQQTEKTPDEIEKSEKEKNISQTVLKAMSATNQVESDGRVLKGRLLESMMDRTQSLIPIEKSQNVNNPSNGINAPIQKTHPIKQSVVEHQKTKILSISDVFNQHLILFHKIKILKRYLNNFSKNEGGMIPAYAKMTRLYEELTQKEVYIDRFFHEQYKANNKLLGKIQTDLNYYFRRLRSEMEHAPKEEGGVIA